MCAFPDPLIIPCHHVHTHTIILLHGRSGNGAEFAAKLFEARTSKGLSLQEHLPGCKWVFPTSQKRFSTHFQEEINQWFDAYSLADPSLREDLQSSGMQQSVAFIQQLIQEEAKAVGGGARSIVVGGFSQGCATAVHAMLSSREKLGAFVGFCGWMSLAGQAQESCNNTNTPVFLSHAKDDGLVKFELGVQLRDILQQQLSTKVFWKGYENGGHWINEPEGYDDLVDFLAIIFGSANSDSSQLVRTDL